jgi:phosphotransferase family enzyme
MKLSPLPGVVQALLPQLGVPTEWVTRVEPMAGGLSGGRVYRLWLRHPDGSQERTRVLKYAEPLEGWLGELSGDVRIREAQLAASGLLADLPRDIATPTLAVAFRGPRDQPEGAALLMRDEQRHLLSNPYWTPPGTVPADALAIVDRLARMHARYWNDPRLGDPALGLMLPEHALLVTGPLGVAARLAAGDTLPYLPITAASWQTFFELAGEVAAQRFQAIMSEPERITRAINQLPRTLVHGDVWGPNLGWLPANPGSRRKRLLLLDWALALAGPATYDPLWLASTWLSIDPTPVLAAYRARLTCALRMRGIVLDGATWLALEDAGYLRTVLTCGEAMARAAVTAPAGVARQMALARLRWWIARALRAAERLERNA